MAHFKNNWYVGSGCGTVDKAVASKRPWVQIRSSVTFIEHVFTLKYEAWRGWAFKKQQQRQKLYQNRNRLFTTFMQIFSHFFDANSCLELQSRYALGQNNGWVSFGFVQQNPLIIALPRQVCRTSLAIQMAKSDICC